MNDHTVKAFDDDISTLRGMVAEMGGLAEAAIAGALQALIKHDAKLAAAVIADDKRIDAIEMDIERLAIQIIALRAPMANDLREVVAALKIGGVLERIGDYAKNIAKRSLHIGNLGKIEPLVLIPAMAEIASEMVRDVLNAFAARDAQMAVRVCETDQKVDGFYNSIFRALVSHMMENPTTIGNAAHLLFVAKNLERIGDHATNVAEMVYYAATGDHMDEREKFAADDDSVGG
ncbi:MAG: phosphate signaling complex protein PhoU [Chakrabartia sp.]